MSAGRREIRRVSARARAVVTDRDRGRGPRRPKALGSRQNAWGILRMACHEMRTPEPESACVPRGGEESRSRRGAELRPPLASEIETRAGRSLRMPCCRSLRPGSSLPPGEGEGTVLRLSRQRAQTGAARTTLAEFLFRYWVGQVVTPRGLRYAARGASTKRPSATGESLRALRIPAELRATSARDTPRRLRAALR